MNELHAKTENVPTSIEVPGRIGHINYAPSMNYSNCRMERFNNEADANLYFEQNKDRLLVAVLPAPDGFYGLVAKSLTDEELKELEEIASIVEDERQKRKAARDEAEFNARLAEEAMEREKLELVQAGRKCRDHHAPLVEKVRKLEDEVKKLRKGKS